MRRSTSNHTPSSANFSNAAFPLGTRPVVAVAATGGAQSKATTQATSLRPVANPNATTTTGTTIAKRAPSSTTTAQQRNAPSTTTSTTATTKLSNSRYDTAKCADPFATSNKKCKTSFAQSYIQGNIPCRLHSSASRYSLQWDQYAAEGFSPDLLLVCADGLCETQHPYVLMAPMMFEQLLSRTQGCVEMLAPIMNTVTGHIRKAILDPATMMAGLKALLQLAQNSGNLLGPYLKNLIPPLAQCMRMTPTSATPGATNLNSKANSVQSVRDTVMMIFGTFEQGCGPEATKLIKAKIPTYN